MISGWVDRDADAVVDRYARNGVGAELALRVYTTRLLGQDRRLVLHGGGNTSLKAKAPDLLGEDTDVIYVKGSGADMAAIEPSGMPAVRLDRLRALRSRSALDDTDMARILRASLIDPAAPNPSVEVLLHAFLPHRYVDHTHAIAVLSLSDQPDGDSICAETFGTRVARVPYVMPGFALAKVAAAAHEAQPDIEGLILHQHGVFTFGDSARESYERMVALVTQAEERLRHDRSSVFKSAPVPSSVAPVADVAPLLRGACTLRNDPVEGAHLRPILEFRTGTDILAYVNGAELTRYSQAGVVTPDHTIRTKNWPLIAPPPQSGALDDFRRAVAEAVERFAARYREYFARNNARAGGGRIMLDPTPRVILVPGLGLFGLGRSAADARIAADIAESAVTCIADAEAIGQFQSIDEAAMFDMEYWPLEQAKLGTRLEKPLAGQVAVITGAGGAIGAAAARAFAQAGAEVVLADVDATAVAARAREVGRTALAVHCDVTDARSVVAAFDRAVTAFGGVDILISNAGAAWQGRIGEVPEETLRKSFELNFYGHQRAAQAAVKIMLAQGTGGCLLFNVSKQAVNPGPNFGPYGLPKAATLFLVRQYALDYGADGIRANAVNADRIRSGLVTPEFIAQRARARNVSEDAYMRDNLLGREVTADDVAQAFLAQALALKTTADVTTVDGGNIAAALR